MGIIRKRRRERRSLKRRTADILDRLRRSESLTLWVEALIVVVAIFMAFQWLKIVRGTDSVARGVAEIGSRANPGQ
jgi:hypothetical protein